MISIIILEKCFVREYKVMCNGNNPIFSLSAAQFKFLILSIGSCQAMPAAEKPKLLLANHAARNPKHPYPAHVSQFETTVTTKMVTLSKVMKGKKKNFSAFSLTSFEKEKSIFFFFLQRKHTHIYMVVFEHICTSSCACCYSLFGALVLLVFFLNLA